MCTLRNSERITDYVARHAERTPEGTAVEFDGRCVTWARWRERIDRARGGLRAAGIGRGDRIAILSENHPAFLELTFAAAGLGAAVVLLNLWLGDDELEYMLGDTGAPVLFVGPDRAGLGRRGKVERTIVVGGDADEYEDFLERAAPLEPDPTVPDESDLLIMYSSGTTGRAKGVVLSQRAAAHCVQATGPATPFAPGDKNMISTPLFHAAGIGYSLVAIEAGAPTILHDEISIEAILDGLASGATCTLLVPTMVAMLLEAGAEAVSAVAQLKYLLYSAAPMPLPVLREALDTWPGTNFVNGYGQTELGGPVTMLLPSDHHGDERLLGSVGRCLPGVELRVVSPEDGRDVAPNETGELWFRTDQRMTRYLNAPDATAETITADGWVRTGDIGRVDAAGYVYLTGRIKDLIIVAGENVYGPEVERVLHTHPAVVDVAVVGVPDALTGEAVHAVVVRSKAVEPEELMAYCAERLGPLKRPTSVEFVGELPRNAGGKVVKRLLGEQRRLSQQRR